METINSEGTSGTSGTSGIEYYEPWIPFSVGDIVIPKRNLKGYSGRATGKEVLTEGRNYRILSINLDDCSGLFKCLKIKDDTGREEWFHYKGFNDVRTERKKKLEKLNKLNANKR